MKRSVLTAVLFFVVLFSLAFTRIAGVVLAPYLEKVLSSLFGMPVFIESLQVNPFTGRVHAEALEFRNQAGFSPGPHLHTSSLDFTIDLPALRHKHVKIGTAAFTNIYYAIEKREFADHRTTNVQAWVRYIKSRRKKTQPAGSEAVKTPGKKWLVTIDEIVINNGTFVYDDRTQDAVENRYVFHKLKGRLSGFKYPEKPQTRLAQHLEISGYLGEKNPAPFKVEGDANFSGGQVSFDLKGKVKSGYMEDYSRYWDDLPIVVKNGRFNLDIRMICIRKMVKSNTLLHLYDLKILPSPKVTQVLWGIPVTTALGFLQKKKELDLRVPISGNISDPQFNFYRAFERAFQEALTGRLKSGLNLFTFAPVKIAAQTRDVVMQTQETITSGIGKITSIVTEKEPKNG